MARWPNVWDGSFPANNEMAIRRGLNGRPTSNAANSTGSEMEDKFLVGTNDCIAGSQLGEYS